MQWEKKICIRITAHRILGAVLTASTVVNLVIVGAAFEAAAPTPITTLLRTTSSATPTFLDLTSTPTERLPFTLSPTNTATQEPSTTLTSTPFDTLAPTPTVCLPPIGWIIYVVRPGENLFRIGLATGMSVGELQSANCLTSSQIVVGQPLYVPRLPPTLTPTNTPDPYPDLLVTVLQVTGSVQVLSEQKIIVVPVYVVIENQGDASADIFKSSAHYTGPGGKFVAQFIAFDESNSWYPYTEAPLPAGQQIRISGEVILPDLLQGQTIALSVLADSCSGDELMPGYCRVLESNEGNNESQQIGITLPSNNPPVVSITIPAADTNGAFDQDPQNANYWSAVVDLSGSAIDPEDGALTGSSLVWSTDRTDIDIYKNNPILGTGTSISPRLYVYVNDCRGHNITLTATDSDGNVALATIKIEAGCVN